ncbi:hypothetical protein N0V82_007629 [Gnomoniopsis sp. IMI 355080]|nr:hypothetical protein N0V82_007629 [Gnomoniopsis sp. IMI 355080]
MSSNFIAAEGPYQYNALKSQSTIRLLKVHPDLFNDEIACTLQHVDKDKLQEKPYSALSYYWGDPKHTRTIFLGHAGDNPALPVTLHEQGLHENLWEFLDQMRCQMKQTGVEPSFLWTDFLCLNQKDKGEVSEQVSRMDEIYSSARRTISWLGRPQRSTSLGTPSGAIGTGTVSGELTELQMDWIPEWVADDRKQALIKKYNLSSSTWHDIKTRRLGRLDPEEPQSYRYFAGKAFISLINILSLPYWKRIWIVQEVALAKRVDLMFGSKTVDYDQFVLVYKGYFFHLLCTARHDIVISLISKPAILRAYSYMKPAIEARERLAGGKMPLWELLQWARNLESLKILDHVYGFLGLFKTLADGETQRIMNLKVDYEREVSNVYWDIAFGCVFLPLDDRLGFFNDLVIELDPYSRKWENLKIVSHHRHKARSISLSLRLLRESLSCSSDLGTLQTFLESARPPPTTQQLMASIAVRLATACRAVGHLCETEQRFLGPGPRPIWIGLRVHVPLWQILIETYLQVDKNGGLRGPDNRQAATIGVLMEADKRLTNEFELGRWVCLADRDAKACLGSIQKDRFTMRFKCPDGTAPQCSRPQCGLNLDSSMTQQECNSSQLILHLPEIDSVLKYEVEELRERGRRAVRAGVISIAFDNLN